MLSHKNVTNASALANKLFYCLQTGQLLEKEDSLD